MATTSTTEPGRTSRKRRWAIPLGALGLSAAALGIFSLATPALAGNSSGSRVVECRSGVVTNGDIQMSAATASRVPAEQVPDPIPGGCSLR